MSSEEPVVASYRHFADEVVPHVAQQGYNALQLMAIQEHPYYGSCGYHVSNLFAVSSRCGSPEDLKYLIDRAHGLGLIVILDVVHSHISTNKTDGLAGFDVGQDESQNYFKLGERGYHEVWDSKLLNYQNWEVLRLLLSNLRWWISEYRFDGFRFDGVTSMLYHHHGIHYHFSGQYGEYFSMATDVDAVVYLMLANKLVHEMEPKCVTIAEDVSGMPTLCCPIERGGVGFDYRMAMAVPELWIRTVREYDDSKWNLDEILTVLQNRRQLEKTIGYVECHDQSIVGGKALSFRLIGPEMWDKMSSLIPPSENIKRGVALHKMIRLITFALGGDAWLNFMGNEFGHPDWIDFPRLGQTRPSLDADWSREGNGWSHDRCRRLWSLIKKPNLRYKGLSNWDAAMMSLQKDYFFLSASHSVYFVRSTRIVVVERGLLLFVFNFSLNNYSDLEIGVSRQGSYKKILDSSSVEFDGDLNVNIKEVFKAIVYKNGLSHSQCSLRLSFPARSCMAFAVI